MSWESEKEQLYDTHYGWFAAYLDGKQVALEPNAESLLLSLERQFGVPRRPCEYHVIGAIKLVGRCSPRCWEQHLSLVLTTRSVCHKVQDRQR